ncbi:MAG: TrkA family potassium uptake protein [Polyangiaceae bacterium]
MRVHIAGAGRGGLSVAIHLAGAGHSVTIVDRDPNVAKRAFELYGIVAMQGDATDASVVKGSEMGRADVVVGMLHRDADNLAVALLARQMGVRRVMVRMRDVEYRAIYERAGVDRILSETDIFVGALATTIEHDAIRHSMVLGHGDSVAFELVIPDDGALVGAAVKDIAVDPEFPKSCVIAGLFVGGRMEAPRGNTIVEKGADVLLVASRADLGATVQFFMKKIPGAAPSRPVRVDGTGGRSG